MNTATMSKAATGAPANVRSAPPLQDLLGASFVFNSTVQALIWDRDFACFGLADGAIVMMHAHWQGAPKLQQRAGGGIEIMAATAPPPPPAIFKAHKGGVEALAAIPVGGILSGGADGAVNRLLDGEITLLETRPRRRIAAVAAGRGGRRAFAAGRHVEISGPEAKRLSLPGAVTSLAYDAAGLFLAVGYEGGISLEACGIRHAQRLAFDTAPHRIAWQADGGAVAVAGAQNTLALRDRALNDWQQITNLPGPVTALAYAANHTLIIAGIDYIVSWRSEFGIAPCPNPHGRTGIGPVSCHPRLDLVAYATAAGAIMLGPLGAASALAIREPGAAVTFMAFSATGDALAFAAADGEAGTIMLPDILFRAGETT